MLTVSAKVWDGTAEKTCTLTVWVVDSLVVNPLMAAPGDEANTEPVVTPLTQDTDGAET